MYNKPAKKANSLCSVTELKTKGVDILLGDPKKAIIKLAIPMIVAMSVQNIYQLIDTYWVSGLGADAMAAMGFVFPFFFVSMALRTGSGSEEEPQFPGGSEQRIKKGRTTSRCTR